MEQKAKYYNDNVREAKRERATYSATMKARARIILGIIKKYGFGKNLLDAGCGTGHLLSLIIKKHPNQFTSIEGTDFSKEACKNTSKILGIKTFEADLKNIKVKKKYDLIICSEVIEHVEDDERVIKNIFNMLNNGGNVIFTVPFLMKNWGRFDEISGHVRRYEPGELENKLKKSGIKILDSFAWGNFIYKKYFEKVLKNSNPHKKAKASLSKKIIANILSYIFMVDNLFLKQKEGITLFVIGKKD